MTPEQRLIAKWVAIALVAVALFGGGYGVRDYIADADATAEKLKLTEQFAADLAKHAEDLKAVSDRNLELQAEVNALNTQHTKALNEKLAENDRLRLDLGVAQRMRLQGTTCPRPAAGADHSSAGSVGTGEGVELSLETRLAVWDLRGSIIRTEAKLAYLQGWAETVMRSNPAIEKPPE